MAAYKARIAVLEELLGSEVIDVQKLRELSFAGVPDVKSIRSLVWKLLLEYLPVVQNTWPEFLKEKRKLYKNFIHDFIVVPGLHRASGDGEVADSICDHPLNPNPMSQWSVYFKENEVLMQIDKDVRRLCPDMSFFQQATSFPCSELVDKSGVVNVLRKRVEYSMLHVATVTKNRHGIQEQVMPMRKKGSQIEEYARLAEGDEAHWEVVERILFIYAKLNPGQGYVQGMNEIIGPMYYTFASDPDSHWSEQAEADTFFCFTNLMSEIRDHFIKTLDESVTGINGLMNKLMSRLKAADLEVYLRLEQQELKPQFYSFRWLTLLLSQEFPLPDVVRIWDSLFADKLRFDFLIDVCLAMILLARNQLLSQDFSNNVKLLQNYPSTDVHLILSKAVECRNRNS